MNIGDWSAMACLKKACAPLFAFDRFRTSLMTLVSTKYMIVSCYILQPLEIFILPDIGHSCEDLRKTLCLGLQQQLFQQRAVLGFGAASVSGGPLFERIDDSLVQIPDDEIGHAVLQTFSFR
jgi:hypothetical protein